jgi:hypothetical protein
MLIASHGTKNIAKCRWDGGMARQLHSQIASGGGRTWKRGSGSHRHRMWPAGLYSCGQPALRRRQKMLCSSYVKRHPDPGALQFVPRCSLFVLDLDERTKSTCSWREPRRTLPTSQTCVVQRRRAQSKAHKAISQKQVNARDQNQ